MLEFNEVDHRPVVLPCGHSICEETMEHINNCGVCRRDLVPWKAQFLGNYPINFSLLQILEEKNNMFYCITCSEIGKGADDLHKGHKTIPISKTHGRFIDFVSKLYSEVNTNLIEGADLSKKIKETISTNERMKSRHKLLLDKCIKEAIERLNVCQTEMTEAVETEFRNKQSRLNTMLSNIDDFDSKMQVYRNTLNQQKTILKENHYREDPSINKKVDDIKLKVEKEKKTFDTILQERISVIEDDFMKYTNQLIDSVKKTVENAVAIFNRSIEDIDNSISRVHTLKTMTVHHNESFLSAFPHPEFDAPTITNQSQSHLLQISNPFDSLVSQAQNQEAERLSQASASDSVPIPQTSAITSITTITNPFEESFETSQFGVLAPEEDENEGNSGNNGNFENDTSSLSGALPTPFPQHTRHQAGSPPPEIFDNHSGSYEREQFDRFRENENRQLPERGNEDSQEQRENNAGRRHHHQRNNLQRRLTDSDYSYEAVPSGRESNNDRYGDKPAIRDTRRGGKCMTSTQREPLANNYERGHGHLSKPGRRPSRSTSRLQTHHRGGNPPKKRPQNSKQDEYMDDYDYDYNKKSQGGWGNKQRRHRRNNGHQEGNKKRGPADHEHADINSENYNFL